MAMICLAAALAGCRRDTSDAANATAAGDAAYAVETQEGGNRVVVRTAQGSAVIRNGAPAAALPPGLMLFPGAAVTTSTTVTPAGKAGDENALLSFTSEARPDAILAFYKEAATRAGYRIDAALATDSLAMLSAARAGESGFTLTILPTAKGSEATLIAGD
jgi:hypothetical protein